MNKPVLITALCLLFGLGVAAYVVGEFGEEPASTVASTGFNEDASVGERVLALEQALAEEREARQTLETELFALIEEVSSLQAGSAGPNGNSATGTPSEIQRLAEEEARALNQAVRVQSRNRNDPDSRAAFLVQQGFTEDRATYIANRESELRYEIMQAQWEARRNGESIDWRGSIGNADLALRAELGAQEYEQYLEAYGRPTAINVNSVMQSSPAAGAGLRSGDQITHYNGERVYNMQDVTRLIANVQTNNNIVINIQRDGVPMQVSLPPGPIGITGSGWRRRR